MQQQLSEQLQEVFRSVFQDESLIISENSSSKEIKMWDSLTHLELIASVEEKFNIKFSFNDVMSFNKVGDMLNAIERLINK